MADETKKPQFVYLNTNASDFSEEEIVAWENLIYNILAQTELTMEPVADEDLKNYHPDLINLERPRYLN